MSDTRKRANLHDDENDLLTLFLAVNNNILRELLNLNDKDILVGSVDEVGITGLYEDDDHVNFLSSIGFFDEDVIFPIKDKIIESSIKEVLEKRNITKLIHVTNKKNLDSILKYGILSLIDLEKDNIDYEFNDSLRLENRRDAVCLSVTEHNYFLFVMLFEEH